MRTETKNLPSKQLLSALEAAELMGMNKRTVERMCATGELPAVKLRKKWLINKNLLYARLGLTNEELT